MLIGQAINPTTDIPKTQALLTFRVAEQWCGLPVTNIARIVDMVALTPMPGAPEVIAGLINVQGKVVPAIDLRLRFGLSPQPYTLETPIIIVNTPHPGRALALIADAVEEVVEVFSHHLTPTETIIPAEMTTSAAFFTGVAAIEQKLILVLNVNDLVSLVEHSIVIQTLDNHNEIKPQESNRSES